jgi:hypothetical protein
MLMETPAAPRMGHLGQKIDIPLMVIKKPLGFRHPALPPISRGATFGASVRPSFGMSARMESAMAFGARCP